MTGVCRDRFLRWGVTFRISMKQGIEGHLEVVVVVVVVLVWTMNLLMTHVYGVVVYRVPLLLGGHDMATTFETHDTVGALHHGAMQCGCDEGGVALRFAGRFQRVVSVVFDQSIYSQLGSLIVKTVGVGVVVPFVRPSKRGNQFKTEN